MPERIIARNKENFAVRCLKGIGYWALGTFMSIFLCMSMLVLMRSLLTLKLFVAFCTTAIMLGLQFNWAHYSAKRDRNAVKYHNMEYDKYMPLKMSIAAPIVSYVMVVLMFLSKAGVIGDIFNYFMYADMWLVPYVKMFTDETTIGAIPWWGVIGLTVLVLLQPAVISVTYILTYKDVDVAKEVLYKK
ncbi:MAG: hypothetical protein NC253_02655 [Ruminococcus sp.]|nr:hypothetical protein [Ruminococcus sp.]MCM1478770.1 hypothetical protein [Muribaculaceae bacterium]